MVNKPELNKQGIYGETTVSPYGVRLRPAGLFERRRLAQQPYVYYVPYVPLVMVPQVPDPLAEFCFAKQKDVDVVHWDLDYELCPKLSHADLVTDKLFGVPRSQAADIFNFANGMILEDQKSKTIIRLVVEATTILEPTISRSRPIDKLLANKLSVVYFGIQTPRSMFRLVPDQQLKTLRVRKTAEGDRGLSTLMSRFWLKGEIIL